MQQLVFPSQPLGLHWISASHSAPTKYWPISPDFFGLWPNRSGGPNSCGSNSTGITFASVFSQTVFSVVYVSLLIKSQTQYTIILYKYYGDKRLLQASRIINYWRLQVVCDMTSNIATTNITSNHHKYRELHQIEADGHYLAPRFGSSWILWQVFGRIVRIGICCSPSNHITVIHHTIGISDVIHRIIPSS